MNGDYLCDLNSDDYIGVDVEEGVEPVLSLEEFHCLTRGMKLQGKLILILRLRKAAANF